MTQAMLVVSRGEQSRSVALNPKGVVLGRNPACDVVLDSRRVSRRHAVVFRDPFGRWLIEDLASRHGVWVGRERIRARAMLPGERFEIGPFSLAVTPAGDRSVSAEASGASTAVFVDDAPTKIAPATQESRVLDRPQIHRLNQIAGRLAELTDPDELYGNVCARLAGLLGGVAMVLRLPGADQAFTGSPETLACRFGESTEDLGERGRGNLRLSRRVLDVLRDEGRAVLASSIHRADADLELTVIDHHTPRAVLAAPITDVGDRLDVLYLDVPGDCANASTLDFVEAVARQIGYACKGLLLAEERAERKALDRQLELARQIQAGLVPTEIQPVPGLDVSVHYQPAMWVGGDYCDTWELADGRVALAIGDVCGKGLPASLLMANLQATLRATTMFCFVAAETMAHVNRLIAQNLPEGLFVTLFLGMFDPASGALEYVNAGHLLPVAVRPGQAPSLLGRPENRPVGVHDGPFHGVVETLPPGTGLVIFTDGVTEAAGSDGEQFGMDRLQAAVGDISAVSAEGLVEAITKSAETFRQPLPQQDDVTVFALLYRGLPDAPDADVPGEPTN